MITKNLEKPIYLNPACVGAIQQNIFLAHRTVEEVIDGRYYLLLNCVDKDCDFSFWLYDTPLLCLGELYGKGFYPDTHSTIKRIVITPIEQVEDILETCRRPFKKLKDLNESLLWHGANYEWFI